MYGKRCAFELLFCTHLGALPEIDYFWVQFNREKFLNQIEVGCTKNYTGNPGASRNCDEITKSVHIRSIGRHNIHCNSTLPE